MVDYPLLTHQKKSFPNWRKNYAGLDYFLSLTRQDGLKASITIKVILIIIDKNYEEAREELLFLLIAVGGSDYY